MGSTWVMNQLLALPAFTDNYVWLIHNGRQALVVDPGDAAPVQQALRGLGLTLTDILVTHHHPDHVAGIPALMSDGLRVHGLRQAASPLINQPHDDGGAFSWSDLPIQVWSTPGHTAVHACFVLPQGLGPDDDAPIAFVGDTLFSAGCGRVFDGSMEQLHTSLQRLTLLPDHTRVCAAHEYTESNLRFAAAVEPDNVDVQAHGRYCAQQRAQGLPTLPTTMGLEKRINPFIRSDHPRVQDAARRQGATDLSPQGVFTTLRTWKNTF